MTRRRGRAGLATLWLVVWGIPASHAQTQGSADTGRRIELAVSNGTNGTPVTAEKVTVFQLAGEMIPVLEQSNVTFPTTLRDIPGTGPQPVLLQVGYSGVTYNQPVTFAEGDTAEAEIVVYETTAEWDPDVMEVITSRILFRRIGAQLSIDEVYVIENRSTPPTTFYDPAGSFLFNLPAEGLIEVRGVSASGASGMPVPQQSFPVEGRPGVFASRTAMKPGETQIGVSFDVEYPSSSFEMTAEAFYPLAELLVLVAPADVEIEGDGFQNLGTEPEGRFSVARLGDVSVGDPIRLRLSGGSADAADLVGSPSTPNANPAPTTGQRMTQLPDPTRAEKWIVVLLMGAALAYGLVSAIMARPSENELDARLKRLEVEHDSGSVPTGEYRARKKELRRELEATSTRTSGR